MEGKKIFVPTRKSQVKCAFLLVVLLSIYCFENYSPIHIRTNPNYTFIARPVMWIIIIAIVSKFRRIKPSGKIRFKKVLIFWTTIFGFIYIFFIMIGGFIEGFGKSPYDHSVIGIIENLIFIFTTLIGRELIRSYLINSHKGKNFVKIILLIAILMTLVNLPVEPIKDLKTKLDITEYIGGEIFPEFATSITASYMVYIGGPILSIIYTGIQQCFYWLFPVLPNLNWITKALIGTLCPIFTLMVLQYVYSCEMKRAGSKHIEKESPFGWIVITVLSILVLWFFAGVFPIRPYTIATGSMEPKIYAGDLVLVEKVDLKDLKLGDIIQYKNDNVYIFHRLIDIVKTEEEVEYRTKGDNNSGPDPDLIKGENIKGKVIYTVPKLGWPTLLLKSDNSVDKKRVEF